MLEKEGYFIRGEMVVNIEGSHTVSPYEFYARPIRVNNNLESAKSDDESMPSNGSDIAVEDDAMITANEELQKYAEELNTFYGHPNNRKFIDIARVSKAAIKDDYYCRIRFLDSGGTEIRILSTLFEIHAMHCDRPPMCLQMCIYGVKPTNDQSQWSANVIKFFRKELREDVPVVVNVVGRY
ncbi:unnamed protein product, partial [Anisakis simplex]|uniref:Tudor domain-containing protein n=1 Tax=Anisakis simplex TaxID=6269 RepID=A0A0M3KGZ0_ANISI